MFEKINISYINFLTRFSQNRIFKIVGHDISKTTKRMKLTIWNYIKYICSSSLNYNNYKIYHSFLYEAEKTTKIVILLFTIVRKIEFLILCLNSSPGYSHRSTDWYAFWFKISRTAGIMSTTNHLFLTNVPYESSRVDFTLYFGL